MDPEPVPPEVPSPAPKPTLLDRTRALWRAVAGWCSRFWADVRPGPETRRGASWGAVAAAFVAAVVGGWLLETGFGVWADLSLALVVGGLLLLVSIALVPLLLTAFRKLPRLASGFVVGSLLVVVLVGGPAGLIVGPILVVVGGVLGATVATFLSGALAGAATRKKVATIGLFVLSLASAVGVVVFLSRDGTLEGQLKAQLRSPEPPMLAADNPGEPGPFTTRVITYGAKGGNPRRPEYDNPTVATPTADASRFFKDFKGWKRSLRKIYWGYGMDRLPLNATVWLPEGPGPFPLVLIVHGNHNMAEFSDPGYRYLGELLASRGFILASIDENFLNSGLFHDPPKQQAVRGWLLLEHLKLWRAWSTDPANPLGVAIDFDRIALVGHSRGGEAVATAALFNRLSHYPDDASIRFDYHFPIRSLVAIAPVDGQYRPAGQWRALENVNYLTIQGANDADVSSFEGSRQWERVTFTDGGDWFKSELYVYRANHGQFNTVWGRSDAGYPLGWILNLKPLLAGEDQRRIGKIYLSAFLEATLHDRREYLPLFRDYRTIRSWLPETFYMNRYEDAAFRLVADFNEDPDVSTTTLAGGRIDGTDLSVWREGRIPFRQGDRGTNGVFLGWNHRNAEDRDDPGIRPAYVVTLPDGAAASWNLSSRSTLVLSLAALDDKAPRLDEVRGGKNDEAKKDRKKSDDPDSKKDPESPDFSVELTPTTARPPPTPSPSSERCCRRSRSGSPRSRCSTRSASRSPTRRRSRPSGSRSRRSAGVDPSRLRTIRLRFDRTPSSVILLSKVGFE